MTAKTRVPMDMHNCFRECDVGTEHLPKNSQACVDNTIRDLVEALSRKRPHWHFVNASYSGSLVGTSYVYRPFVIEDAGDALGSITAERHWHTGEVWYELTNHRLLAKRERKGATRTKDLNKAVKLIEHHYYGPTLDERIHTALDNAARAVNEIKSDARWAVDRAVRVIQPELTMFLANKHEVREELINLAPHCASELKSLPDLVRNRTAAQDFVGEMNLGASSIVLLLGDKLYLTNSANSKEPHTFDTLPKHIAMAVGMLKLVDVKGFIPDIGVRVDHNVFYVMSQKEDI